ncbi:MAG TPA: pyridoxal-phosphate dependent enzyme [Agriterribacter sp.]|nr:pyridoxal-phosphate dependent enzyme [Agriterribacter sp.]
MRSIWKYSSWLPGVEERSRIMLGEGETPLVASRALGKRLGLKKLFFKLENINPTGSYKDRFAAMAVSRLVNAGIKNCFATSSGNTGAALAGYCAAAGIQCYVMVVDGAPAGKLDQMLCYGAHILMVKGFGKDLQVTGSLMERYARTAESHGSPVQISAYKYSPEGMSGVQTIAYEISGELPGEPLHVFVPAGGGGLLNAMAKGFKKWAKENRQYDASSVHCHCVQPEGNDTIATPLRTGREKGVVLANSTTAISGLQVPNVLDGDEVIRACRETGGTGFTVTDTEVYDAQHLLSTREGIFCEPAGAVAYAGLVNAVRAGTVKAETVVCLVTGSGFKDPHSMKRVASGTAYNYFNTINETFEFIRSNVKNQV